MYTRVRTYARAILKYCKNFECRQGLTGNHEKFSLYVTIFRPVIDTYFSLKSKRCIYMRAPKIREICSKVRCLVCYHMELCQEEKASIANLPERFSINSLPILIKIIIECTSFSSFCHYNKILYISYIFAVRVRSEHFKISYANICQAFIFFIFYSLLSKIRKLILSNPTLAFCCIPICL